MKKLFSFFPLLFLIVIHAHTITGTITIYFLYNFVYPSKTVKFALQFLIRLWQNIDRT